MIDEVEYPLPAANVCLPTMHVLPPVGSQSVPPPAWLIFSEAATKAAVSLVTPSQSAP